MTEASTRWATVHCDWIDTSPDTDVIVVGLLSQGKHYVVSCAGPKNMEPDEFITAIRAAAAVLIRAGGGDLSTVAAKEVTPADDAKFDTGTQRAN